MRERVPSSVPDYSAWISAPRSTTVPAGETIVTITARALAKLLNGRNYGDEITNGEAQAAKNAGLVVAFGYSDDNVELRGAIRDELSAYGGLEFEVTPNGLLRSDCDEGCPNFEYKRKSAGPIAKIKATYHSSWRFETKIPHETFKIMEDDELFCEGIVFALADVKDQG